MTVQELIDLLSALKDKSYEVQIGYSECDDRGCCNETDDVKTVTVDPQWQKVTIQGLMYE